LYNAKSGRAKVAAFAIEAAIGFVLLRRPKPPN